MLFLILHIISYEYSIKQCGKGYFTVTISVIAVKLKVPRRAVAAAAAGRGEP